MSLGGSETSLGIAVSVTKSTVIRTACFKGISVICSGVAGVNSAQPVVFGDDLAEWAEPSGGVRGGNLRQNWQGSGWNGISSENAMHLQRMRGIRSLRAFRRARIGYANADSNKRTSHQSMNGVIS